MFLHISTAILLKTCSVSANDSVRTDERRPSLLPYRAHHSSVSTLINMHTHTHMHMNTHTHAHVSTYTNMYTHPLPPHTQSLSLCVCLYRRYGQEQLKKIFLKFSQEIAFGMLYLSRKSFVHRDLAARNVLITKDLTCKVNHVWVGVVLRGVDICMPT